VAADKDPLGLSAEHLRKIGYETVDLLVEQLTDRSIPAMRGADHEDLRARLSGPPPEQGRDWSELLEQTERDVLGPISRLAHPRYFAFIPASSTFPGALGDLISSALDIDVGSWRSAAGPSQLELTVLDWFKDWIGYPAAAAGVLVSGGSAANITALACAREALLGPMSDRVVAYIADQTHSSMARAARLLGFRPDQVRVLPTDGDHRLRIDALAGAVDADASDGFQPLIVAANAGATNTGAIDPLPELADFCRERGMWLHVDAAYGGFAALTARGRAALAGIELADSVTLDPHKWLYQPIECGCLLVREGRLLREAFTINPDYLSDYKSEEVDFSDLGLQLTRSARALKIWLSLHHYGTDAFRRAIDRTLDLAQLAQEIARDSPELELLSPASLGIICFRRRFDDAADATELARLNAQLVADFEATGRGLVSSTLLHGTYAIRLCVMNHTTGEADVRETLTWFAQTPRPLVQAPPESLARRRDRHADVRGGWGHATEFEFETLRSVPLFAELDEPALELIAGSARAVAAGAGETVIGLWRGTRNFYVILAGTVAVSRDEELLRELGPGEFFGELAALDWGAGFGYARTASVVATTPARLLMLPPAAFGQLLRRAPELEQQIRATARERMQRI
jgi:aromatic-L-amino-acid/L-tryptophan decarboxylase